MAVQQLLELDNNHKIIELQDVLKTSAQNQNLIYSEMHYRTGPHPQFTYSVLIILKSLVIIANLKVIIVYYQHLIF